MISVLSFPTRQALCASGLGILLLSANVVAVQAAEPAKSGEPRVAVANDKPTRREKIDYTISGPGIGAFLAGRQAKMDGNTRIAADYYARAVAEDPDNYWLARRSFIINVGDGRLPESLVQAERVLQHYDRAPIANLVTAVDHLTNQRFGKAEALVARVMKGGGMRQIGPPIRAWAAFGAGDTEGALQRLSPLESRKAQNHFRLYQKVLLLGASGDAAGAIAAFDEMVGTARIDLRTRLIYGALLKQRDGAEAAQAYLTGLTARYGEDPVLKIYLSGAQDIADAFPVKTATDGIAEALYATARALSADSINDVSRIYLQMALFARPDLDVAQSLLGNMLEDAGHKDEAIAAYQAIADDSPYKWSARISIAWALDAQDRTEEAAALLRQMADERPDNVTTLATLADIYRGHRRFADAAKVYEEAVSRISDPGPRHWSIYYALGIAQERSKLWTEAEANLLRALELSPNQPLVMNYLGYSWADQGVKLDDAVAMLQKAVDLRPTDGYVIDSLGWVHYRAGNFKEAVTHLERATELRPEDPTINDHLGDVYWHVGRRLESCFQWRHAMSLDPDEDQIAQIQAKLDHGPEGKGSGFRGCTF